MGMEDSTLYQREELLTRRSIKKSCKKRFFHVWSHQTTIFQQDNAPCHTSKSNAGIFPEIKSQCPGMAWQQCGHQSDTKSVADHEKESCFQTPPKKTLKT